MGIRMAIKERHLIWCLSFRRLIKSNANNDMCNVHKWKGWEDKNREFAEQIKQNWQLQYTIYKAHLDAQPNKPLNRKMKHQNH